MSSHGVCSILIACSFSSPFAYVRQANVARSADSPVALPQIPLPSGSFGIGRIGLQLDDASRADDYDPKQRRKLMVYLWYPTSKSPTAKGQYFPGAAQMDAMPEIHSLMNRDFGSAWAGIVSGEISSHAIDRAPIAGSQTPFPVVTFSHGLGSTGFQYTVLIEDLVSHGYVVASIEHTYTANAVWFPDGRVVTLHHDAAPPGSPKPSIRSWGRIAFRWGSMRAPQTSVS